MTTASHARKCGLIRTDRRVAYETAHSAGEEVALT